MTSPAGGFRIARAFVEIEGKVDRAGMRRDAESAGSDSGSAYGSRFARSAGERLRGPDGRFISDGIAVHTSVSKSRAEGDKYGNNFAFGIGGGLRRASKFFEHGLQGAIDAIPTPVKQGLGIAIATTAGPLVAAAMSGAVAGGIGAGGVIGGSVIAFRDPAIRVAAKKLGSDIGDNLTTAARPFRAVTMQVIDDIGVRADKVQPRLASIFTKSAPHARTLVDGMLDGVENFAESWDRALDNAGPGVDALASAMRDLGDYAGTALEIIASGSEDGGQALKDLVDIVGFMIFQFANAVRAVTGTYGALRDFAEWVGVVDEAQQSGRRTGGGYFGQMKAGGGAIRGVTADSNAYNQRQLILNGTIEEAIEVTGDYKKMLDILNGATMNAEEAAIAHKEAIANATKAVKDNGRTLDINTEKGRANRTALLGIAKAAQNEASAAYEKVFRATGNVSQAQAAATGKLNAGRQAFINIAQRMGMTRQQAISYANSIYAIPGSKHTTITANISSAAARIQQIKNALARVPGSKTIHIRTVADIPAGMSIGQLMREHGGPVKKGHAYIVGEKRAEVFVPDRDGMIVPSIEKFEGIASSAGAARGPGSRQGGPATAPIYIGTVTLDASKMKDIQDVIDLIERIGLAARTRYAGRPSPAGARL